MTGNRTATTRHYLMCPPTYFDVRYAINPWMDPSDPVDTERAVAQWESLLSSYRGLGHHVERIDPLPGLPDMVFAANGALVVDGTVFGSRFRYPERAAEADAYLEWFVANGYRDPYRPQATVEGEGDLLVVGDRVLAGTGFRTDKGAHSELSELTGREVVTLELIDPRFYHLDTALAVLDDATIAYHPPAFSMAARERLRRLYPEALLVDESDAQVLGLNAVSDGRHVVLPVQADRLAVQLRRSGFEPIDVDMSELLKAGGGPKCCTLEIRKEVGHE